MSRTIRPWLSLLTLLGAASCASTSGTLSSLETSAAKLLVSDEQESQLGLQVKQELEQKQNVKYVSDPVVANYVREVAGKVLEVAKKDRPEVQWTVNVIDDPKTVNAFATPGGYLYVYTGLLLLADNEAELAAVLKAQEPPQSNFGCSRRMRMSCGLPLTGSR